jgi:hypothetical protein
VRRFEAATNVRPREPSKPEIKAQSLTGPPNLESLVCQQRIEFKVRLVK